MAGVNQYKGKHELQPWSIFLDNLWRGRRSNDR
ncbi:hypothetical protein CN917_20265 [Bacillus thuringiensis]|uniref:Uncharacterized protein n=3 Tax=Bacillus cereus group TaxID=86661 RepID=A0A9X7GAK8_BACTU|nr:hypothetical protein CAB88_15040 [Bacillus thuringiensis]AUB63892.1 hypothetical protein CSW12_12935 [Bacillus cereus]OTW40162.1 hypothetical protein BK698_17510 [Bacillus thuringiensis serovar thuringiensis]OTW57028.1 hypothetical protein BK703_13025 [Bacillus thuringiensis serovar silo]OTW64816.1 hypothetical protein BK700_13915 [Bacillus thuringiensis serovar toguchini]OTZ76666.1 hypothetical protein BK767_06415 [Bacillus thuringiensis serovar kyushuensis]OTZ82827.1 hypothetical protein